MKNRGGGRQGMMGNGVGVPLREREMDEEDSNRCAGGERKRIGWRMNKAHVGGESIVGEIE